MIGSPIWPRGEPWACNEAPSGRHDEIIQLEIEAASRRDVDEVASRAEQAVVQADRGGERIAARVSPVRLGSRSRGAPRRPSSSLPLRSSRCSWTGSVRPPPRPRTPPIDLPGAHSTGAGRCRSLPVEARPTGVRARPTARSAPWDRPGRAGSEFEGGSGRAPPGCSMRPSPRSGVLERTQSASAATSRLWPCAGDRPRAFRNSSAVRIGGGLPRPPLGLTGFGPAGGVGTSGLASSPHGSGRTTRARARARCRLGPPSVRHPIAEAKDRRPSEAGRSSRRASSIGGRCRVISGLRGGLGMGIGMGEPDSRGS